MNYLETYGVTEQEYDQVCEEAHQHFAEQQAQQVERPVLPRVVYREGLSTRIVETEIGFDIYTHAGFIGTKTVLEGARNYLRESQDGERQFCQTHDI